MELLKTEKLLALLPYRLVQQAIQVRQLAEIPLPIDLPLPGIGMLLPQALAGPALEELASFLREFEHPL